ncbi:unnamed protein product [Pleuronectes platessa]|uniref:Uncharacterized protein n=1 Tax=Pleuronectes platessa TaxID=8262 RepID=A0A9N7V9K0_PLEPL|nr:unnamed protein product [Pleuronectes platessa]
MHQNMCEGILSIRRTSLQLLFDSTSVDLYNVLEAELEAERCHFPPDALKPFFAAALTPAAHNDPGSRDEPASGVAGERAPGLAAVQGCCSGGLRDGRVVARELSPLQIAGPHVTLIQFDRGKMFAVEMPSTPVSPVD